MIKLFATGLAMAAFVVGVALLALWARNRLAGLRAGAIDPRALEVLGRVGLHANQGLAVVRVGRRYLLVSSGDGGARLLTELDEEDLERTGDEDSGTTIIAAAHPTAVSSGGFPARLQQAMALSRRVRTSLPLVLVLAAGAFFFTADASAQTPPQPRPDVFAPGGPLGDPMGPGRLSDEIIPPGALGGVPVPGAVGGPSGFGSIYEALPPVALQIGDEQEGLRLSGSVGTVVILGLLTLAPTLLLLTTSFTRILIVLHLLRQALGTQNTPPGHLLAGLALLLTGAVMAPTIQHIRVISVDPWMAGQIDEGTALRAAAEPMRQWMFSHTRETDLRTFLQISRTPPPMTPADVPTTVLMSAYVTSELRTAFEIGFAIFLPFIVIDLVVAAVLTSMGMFMLPPTMIALPCKLMLFVLMDGWTLLLGSLAQSFL